MVRIAIAGGSGSVALEVIDGLLATNKHDVLILSRQNCPDADDRRHVQWLRTSYEDPKQLSQELKGVHTVLSFITTQSDTNHSAQRNLIDASVCAGVKRFAPSEWVGQSFEHMPWYVGKSEIREYLQEINKDGKVLEYTLFQPGLFTNYFAHPLVTAKHFRSFPCHIDFEKCRALVRAEDGLNDRITLTTLSDLIRVVVEAVSFEGEWPVVGGVQGCELSIRDLIAIGEKARGQPFEIEYLKTEDLQAGIFKASWLPVIDHPGMSDAEKLAAHLNSSMMLAISAGALNVGNQWNCELPGIKFAQAEKFLCNVWSGHKAESDS